MVCGRAKSNPHNWLTAYRCLAYWISHAIYKDGQSNMGVITVTPGLRRGLSLGRVRPT